MIWLDCRKLRVWHDLVSGFVLFVHIFSDIVGDEKVMN